MTRSPSRLDRRSLLPQLPVTTSSSKNEVPAAVVSHNTRATPGGRGGRGTEAGAEDGDEDGEDDDDDDEDKSAMGLRGVEQPCSVVGAPYTV